jgi:hypothetical protein
MIAPPSPKFAAGYLPRSLCTVRRQVPLHICVETLATLVAAWLLIKVKAYISRDGLGFAQDQRCCNRRESFGDPARCPEKGTEGCPTTDVSKMTPLTSALTRRTLAVEMQLMPIKRACSSSD